MKAREFDPLKLDVEALARAGAELQGQWPLGGFERLASALHPQARPGEADRVSWSARGELRERRGEAPEVGLQLRARACVALECQRCLQPVEEALDLERSFLFVRGEERAAELDAEAEEDVLALTRNLDLHGLLEDELLLALPLVPRHERCPTPLAAAVAQDEPELEERPNAFAALAALKRGRPLS